MLLFLATAIATSILPVQAEQPNRQPQLASAPDLTALVFASGNSIWFSASHNKGVTFSPAVKVTDVPLLAVGRHRGPHVTISGKTIVVTAVSGRRLAAGPHAHGLPSDGDLLAWSSTDGGRSWSKPVVINDVPGSAREGLHAIAADEHNGLAAVWLDLRGTGTRLYGAYSNDRGATWSKNVLIYESPDGTICQCCDPSIIFSGPHRAEVMFRNVIHGSRDMYLANWNLGSTITSPQKLGKSSWKIDACPMDGGGLAHRGKTVTAWRRDTTVYFDEPGHPEIPLGEGKDVALALAAKGAYIAWADSSGIELHKPDSKEPVRLSHSGSYPNLATLPNGSVLAGWEQDGKIELEIIP
jgi:hypothetical protein